MAKRIKGNQVRYYILYEYRKKFYKVGQLVIKKGDGDLYFVPSDEYSIPLYGLEENPQIKKLNKISFHQSGEMHLSLEGFTAVMRRREEENSPNDKSEVRKGLSLKNTGYFDLFTIFIKDVTILQSFEADKIDPFDILVSTNRRRNLSVNLKIISGKLILSGVVQTNNVSSRAIKIINRAVEHESGTTNKLLHFVFDNTGKAIIKNGGNTTIRLTDLRVPLSLEE